MMLYGSSFVLSRLGRHEEAVEAAERCVELMGKASHTLGRLAVLTPLPEILEAHRRRSTKCTCWLSDVTFLHIIWRS